MTDREKTILGLYQHCKGSMFDRCGECPYYDVEDHEPFQCRDELLHDTLKLLSEQEAKQVKTDMYGNAYCPWCSTDRTIEMGLLRLHLGTQFCPYCGKAVKWDE